MAYLLDDSWDNCGPVARAGNAAFGVYVRCGIWVARNLTDGFVPGEIVAAYGAPELARKLVDVGLWEMADGGYRVVDYLGLNKPRDKVIAAREAERKRKAAWRDKTRESARSPTGTDAGIPRLLSPPKGGSARASTVAPPHPFGDDDSGWCSRCGLPRINKIHSVRRSV